MYHWEFTDAFVQEKPNIVEYFWIRSSVEVRNDTESAWIILEAVQGRESFIFQTYVTFSIDFSNTYNDYLLAKVIDSSLLLFW